MLARPGESGLGKCHPLDHSTLRSGSSHSLRTCHRQGSRIWHHYPRTTVCCKGNTRGNIESCKQTHSYKITNNWINETYPSFNKVVLHLRKSMLVSTLPTSTAGFYNRTKTNIRGEGYKVSKAVQETLRPTKADNDINCYTWRGKYLNLIKIVFEFLHEPLIFKVIQNELLEFGNLSWELDACQTGGRGAGVRRHSSAHGSRGKNSVLV